MMANKTIIGNGAVGEAQKAASIAADRAAVVAPIGPVRPNQACPQDRRDRGRTLNR